MNILANLLPCVNSGDDLIVYINVNRIALIHECVQFHDLTDEPHVNVFMSDGEMVLTTPTKIPIPTGWHEGIFMFDPHQSSLAEELDLEAPPFEFLRPYRCWFNPTEINAILVFPAINAAYMLDGHVVFENTLIIGTKHFTLFTYTHPEVPILPVQQYEQ